MGNIIEKEIELKLTIKYKIEDFSKENIKEDLKTYTNYKELINDESMWEYIEIQKRLFERLLEEKSLLKKFIEGSVYSTAYEYIDSLANCTDADDIEQLYELSQNLDKESDVKLFNDAELEGVFIENSEHVCNRFKAEITKCEIVDKI